MICPLLAESRHSKNEKSKIKIAFIKVVLAMLIICLTGCDPFFGVKRISAPIEELPKTECVLKVLKSEGGMRSVRYHKQVLDNYVVHRFLYTYKDLENSLSYIVPTRGVTELHHGYGSVGIAPSQDDVDLIYPMILRVEKALEDQCNLSDLEITTKQFCSAVRCGNK